MSEPKKLIIEPKEGPMKIITSGKEITVTAPTTFVEKSAYDEVVQQLKEAQQELKILKNPSDGRCMEIGALREHRKSLQEQVELLEQTVEWYASHNGPETSEYHRAGLHKPAKLTLEKLAKLRDR